MIRFICCAAHAQLARHPSHVRTLCSLEGCALELHAHLHAWISVTDPQLSTAAPGRCKIVYEDNEEEYSDFYDYSLGEENDEDGDEQGAGSSEGKELVAAGGRASAGPAAAVVTYAHELMVPGKDGAGSKVLGSREFARYYRQRHRPVDERQIVVVNQMHAKWVTRRLSVCWMLTLLWLPFSWMCGWVVCRNLGGTAEAVCLSAQQVRASCLLPPLEALSIRLICEAKSHLILHPSLCRTRCARTASAPCSFMLGYMNILTPSHIPSSYIRSQR